MAPTGFRLLSLFGRALNRHWPAFLHPSRPSFQARFFCSEAPNFNETPLSVGGDMQYNFLREKRVVFLYDPFCSQSSFHLQFREPAVRPFVRSTVRAHALEP